MKPTPKNIGELIKQTRKSLKVTQRHLALTSGTGLRFIIDLEKGKPTCQLSKLNLLPHNLKYPEPILFYDHAERLSLLHWSNANDLPKISSHMLIKLIKK